ncbi:MAG: hypothetical protein WA814_01340 [Candidatus Baltobacteraceae bacterium]
MTSTSTIMAATFFGTSLFLAGCGGAAQSPAAAGLPAVLDMQRQMELPQDHQGCPNDGGITVRPCRIKFDANHSGPQQVMVTHGGDGDRNGGHTIKERDDCAGRNIATVTRDSNHAYTVTAGTAMGSCSASFDDNGNHGDDRGGNGNGNRGNGNGSNLRIVNQI